MVASSYEFSYVFDARVSGWPALQKCTRLGLIKMSGERSPPCLRHGCALVPLIARTAAGSLASLPACFTCTSRIIGKIPRSSLLLPTLARSALGLLGSFLRALFLPAVTCVLRRAPLSLLAALSSRLAGTLGIVGKVAGASALIIVSTLIARHVHAHLS